MQTQQTPQVLEQPFAAQGDKNTIPNAATGTNKASLQEGFPPITGQPINQGGIPPERADFNGAMNLNSQFYFAFQNGWWPTFSQEVSDAIGGYPQGAVLWLFDMANKVYTPLLSLVGNNTYNFNTNKDYIGQYWAKILPDSGRGLPLGAVYFSSSSNADDNPGGLPLWTGEYFSNASSLYPDFYNWVKSHTELCKTKTEYDAAISTYGECPYYVVDEVAGSLRLPKLSNYIKMANSTEGITQKGAGLPDHDHIMHGKGAIAGSIYLSNNAASYGRSGGETVGKSSTPATTMRTGDASESNSIYGNSTTVTPAHTTLYPWIIVNSKTVSPSQYVLLSQIGTANGVASLDADTKVPMAQIPSEVTDNLDLDFDPSAYNWPDIRPAARPNAIVLMAGVKADYSAYDNLGFIATCEGGYNVFIDGVQYGDTYASGAQCSVTWSQYSATAGFPVTQPEALTAHIVQIVPATYGNTISAYKCARVAASGIEQQGVLWVHFNMDEGITLNFLLYAASSYRNLLCVAITAKDNVLTITGNYINYLACLSSLVYIPVLKLVFKNSQLGQAQSTFQGTQIQKVVLDFSECENFMFTNTYSLFQDCNKLNTVILKGLSSYRLNSYFKGCSSLVRLPILDWSNVEQAVNFLTSAEGLEDTVLDLGYADNLQVLGITDTLGLKGLTISKNAPFDYASAPQINVSSTGLDQAALVALFNSLPTVTAGQVINITGATGAASLTAEQLAIATNKGWTVTR